MKNHITKMTYNNGFNLIRLRAVNFSSHIKGKRDNYLFI